MQALGMEVPGSNSGKFFFDIFCTPYLPRGDCSNIGSAIRKINFYKSIPLPLQACQLSRFHYPAQGQQIESHGF